MIGEWMMKRNNPNHVVILFVKYGEINNEIGGFYMSSKSITYKAQNYEYIFISKKKKKKPNRLSNLLSGKFAFLIIFIANNKKKFMKIE